MDFIVQTLTTDRHNTKQWSLHTFLTYNMAKAWADTHPRSLVFRTSQVARIVDNRIRLRAQNAMPVTAKAASPSVSAR